jgi:hypothetical protein
MSANVALNETKQNILLRNCKKISDFLNRRGADATSRVQSRGFYTLQINEPELAINKITGIDPKYAARFINMKNLERNFLVPILEISRVASDGIETPIQFTGHFTEEYVNFMQDPKIDVLSQDGAPVSGCGIKRLTIEERPENLADVNIKATMELVFENAAALLQSNIRELITVPKKMTKEDPLDYRLRVRVGWRVPEDVSGYIDDEFKEAIDKCNKLYLFELIGHNLSFKSNGKISLTINYQGALEAAFESERADILSLDNFEYRFYTLTKDVFVALENYKKEKKELEDLLKKKDEIYTNSSQFEIERKVKEIDSKIKTKEEEIQKSKKTLLNFTYSKFLNKLYKNSFLYTIEIEEEWFKTQPFKSLNDLAQTLISATNFGLEAAGSTSTYSLLDLAIPGATSQDFLTKDPEVEKRPIGDIRPENGQATPNVVSVTDSEIEFNGTDPDGTGEEPDPDEDEVDEDKVKIAFFTYGDLIESIVDTLLVGNLEQYKIVLGSIRYYNNKDQTTSLINLADIPISVDLFNQWFFNTVIKERRETMFLKQFIIESLQTLITPLLGFKNSAGQPLFGNFAPDITIITSTENISLRNFDSKVLSETDLKNIIRTSEKDIKKSQKTYQYMIVNLLWPPPGTLKGKFEDDLENGIQHIRLGQTDGILRNISFEKTDFSEYRSARMVGDQLNTAGQILREQYDCTVNVIGNPLFHNGSYFYVDSVYMGDIGRAAQNILGVGGYYLINGIETTIYPHKYDMTVKGFWQFAGTEFYGTQADMINGQEGRGAVRTDLKRQIGNIDNAVTSAQTPVQAIENTQPPPVTIVPGRFEQQGPLTEQEKEQQKLDDAQAAAIF